MGTVTILMTSAIKAARSATKVETTNNNDFDTQGGKTLVQFDIQIHFKTRSAQSIF